MTTWLFALVLGAGGIDAATGDWVTPENKSIVRLGPCDQAPDTLCGTIVKLKSRLDFEGDPWRDKENDDPALQSRPLMGLQILTGMAPRRDGRFKGGRIYNPEDGNTYKAVLTLDGEDRLELKGCVLVFCRTQSWRRATQEDWDRPVLDRAE